VLSPNGDGTNDKVRVFFTLSGPGLVTLEVLDVNGAPVARPLQDAYLEGGNHEASWTGTTSAGFQALEGSYTYKVIWNHSELQSGSFFLSLNDQLPQSFADVPSSHIFFDFVAEIAERGITGGCGGGNFCVDFPVTRAQMAVFLNKGLKGHDFVPAAPTGLFQDVPVTHWAAAWIEQLVNEQLTSGCGSNTFCPDQVISRAQMAVFLLKARYGPSYSPSAATGIFSDVPVSYWAAAWIEQLAAEGITSGCGGGRFCPDAPVSRGQMSAFLSRVFEF